MKSLLLVLVLVVAGCSTADPAPQAAPTAPTSAADAAGQTLSVITAESPSASEPDQAGARQRPEGRPAPDFVLPLGQGGEFSLSAEAKPVYMVFWAEW